MGIVTSGHCDQAYMITSPPLISNHLPSPLRSPLPITSPAQDCQNCIMKRDLLPTALFLLLAIAFGSGFLAPRSFVPSAAKTEILKRSPGSILSSAADDDEEEESIDPDSLGDWRAFRMNLANSDPSSAAASSIDGLDLESADDPSASATFPTTVTSRPKSVSKENEELLTAQNSAMAEEYLNGVWAHESAVPEVGGLVCRMPLEVELHRGGPESALCQKLTAFLESDEYGSAEEAVPRSLASSPATGGAASVGARASREATAGGDDEPSSFSALAAQTTFWYRGAEKVLQWELAKVMAAASAQGEINPRALDKDGVEFLQMYLHHQNSWQAVELVVEQDGRTGAAKTLTINRPMAFQLSESLGRTLLLGAAYAEKGGAMVNAKESNGVETRNVVKLLSAFENKCAVYVGGPDGMDQPATLIHGIAGLAGAVELAPGTGIYRGGVAAACDGVLAGRHEPLDFRFFVGHTKYVRGALDESVRRGRHQPVACSRPLVLKQCIQLPKPLWHEVLEFCGGELKEISRLELAKRDDLR